MVHLQQAHRIARNFSFPIWSTRAILLKLSGTGRRVRPAPSRSSLPPFTSGYAPELILQPPADTAADGVEGEMRISIDGGGGGVWWPSRVHQGQGLRRRFSAQVDVLISDPQNDIGRVHIIRAEACHPCDIHALVTEGRRVGDGARRP